MNEESSGARLWRWCAARLALMQVVAFAALEAAERVAAQAPMHLSIGLCPSG